MLVSPVQAYRTNMVSKNNQNQNRMNYSPQNNPSPIDPSPTVPSFKSRLFVGCILPTAAFAIGLGLLFNWFFCHNCSHLMAWAWDKLIH